MIHQWGRYFLLVLLTGSLAVLAGCNPAEVAGVAASTAEGPKTIKAKYVPAKEPMLVLVESYGNAGDVSGDAVQVGTALNQQLTTHQIAPLVDPTLLEKLQDENPPKYQAMHIESLGRVVGSKQVLYVDVLSAEVESPSTAQASRGTMLATVRIVDSATGETRWPLYARYGQLVQVDTPWTHDQTSAEVHTQMINQMAEQISKLFYDSAPDEDPDMK
jgi:hypothetical protein